MQKRLLFFIILAVFIATTAVTLLGLTGYLTIKDEYLRGLVGAFLLESAAAVIAIVRTADFFPKEPDGLAAVTKELEASTRDKTAAENELRTARLRLAALEAEKRTLTEAIADMKSLRLRVLGVLGARSMDVRGAANELAIGARAVDLAELQAVIGSLESDGEIEPDPDSPRGYYRRRTRRGDS